MALGDNTHIHTYSHICIQAHTCVHTCAWAEQKSMSDPAPQVSLQANDSPPSSFETALVKKVCLPFLARECHEKLSVHYQNILLPLISLLG